MSTIKIAAPVHALQIMLTCTERGWNVVVMHDGVPLRSEDPLDVPSVEQALAMALDALRLCWGDDNSNSQA